MEIKTEADDNDVEIKIEADDNDVGPHNDSPSTGMFAVFDAVFSAFISVCNVYPRSVLTAIFPDIASCPLIPFPFYSKTVHPFAPGLKFPCHP